MKIPRALRIISFITCSLFTFTTVANSNLSTASAPPVSSPVEMAERMRAVDTTTPRDLAAKPLSQVIQEINALIQKSPDREAAARYAQSLLEKDAEGKSERIKNFERILDDEQLLKEHASSNGDILTSLKEAERKTVIRTDEDRLAIQEVPISQRVEELLPPDEGISGIPSYATLAHAWEKRFEDHKNGKYPRAFNYTDGVHQLMQIGRLEKVLHEHIFIRSDAFPRDFSPIVPPFTGEGFNFSKASDDQRLMNLEVNKRPYILLTAQGWTAREHMLFIPQEARAQEVYEDMVFDATTLSERWGTRFLQNGWGIAALNSVHFHMFKEPFPAEAFSVKPESIRDGVTVGKLADYLCETIVLEGGLKKKRAHLARLVFEEIQKQKEVLYTLEVTGNRIVFFLIRCDGKKIKKTEENYFGSVGVGAECMAGRALLRDEKNMTALTEERFNEALGKISCPVRVRDALVAPIRQQGAQKTDSSSRPLVRSPEIVGIGALLVAMKGLGVNPLMLMSVGTALFGVLMIQHIIGKTPRDLEDTDVIPNIQDDADTKTRRIENIVSRIKYIGFKSQPTISDLRDIIFFTQDTRRPVALYASSVLGRLTEAGEIDEILKNLFMETFGFITTNAEVVDVVYPRLEKIGFFEDKKMKSVALTVRIALGMQYKGSVPVHSLVRLSTSAQAYLITAYELLQKESYMKNRHVRLLDALRQCGNAHALGWLLTLWRKENQMTYRYYAPAYEKIAHALVFNPKEPPSADMRSLARIKKITAFLEIIEQYQNMLIYLALSLSIGVGILGVTLHMLTGLQSIGVVYGPPVLLLLIYGATITVSKAYIDREIAQITDRHPAEDIIRITLQDEQKQSESVINATKREGDTGSSTARASAELIAFFAGLGVGGWAGSIIVIGAFCALIYRLYKSKKEASPFGKKEQQEITEAAQVAAVIKEYSTEKARRESEQYPQKVITITLPGVEASAQDDIMARIYKTRLQTDPHLAIVITDTHVVIRIDALVKLCARVGEKELSSTVKTFNGLAGKFREKFQEYELGVIDRTVKSVTGMKLLGSVIPSLIFFSLIIGGWVALLTSVVTIGYFVYYIYRSCRNYVKQSTKRHIAVGLMVSVGVLIAGMHYANPAQVHAQTIGSSELSSVDAKKMDALFSLYANQTKSEAVRRAAGIELIETYDARLIPFLLEQLRVNNDIIQGCAVNLLAFLGEEAVPALFDFYRDDENRKYKYSQVYAGYAIDRIGDKTIPYLIRQAEYLDRLRAVTTLLPFQRESALRELQNAFFDTSVSGVALSAQMALIGSFGENAIPPLVNVVLTSDNNISSMLALEGLKIIGPPAIKPMEHMVQDPRLDPTISMIAQTIVAEMKGEDLKRLFEKMKPSGRQATDILIINEQFSIYKLAVKMRLGKEGKWGKDFKDAYLRVAHKSSEELFSLYADETNNESLRHQAAAALLIRGKGKASFLIQKLINENNQSAGSAAMLLEILRTEAMPALFALYIDKNTAGEKKDIAWQLLKKMYGDAIPYLLTQCENENNREAVREIVVVMKEKAVPALIKALEDTRVNGHAVDAQLLLVSLRDLSVPYLIKHIKESDNDISIMLTVTALELIGTPAVTPLESMLARETLSADKRLLVRWGVSVIRNTQDALMKKVSIQEEATLRKYWGVETEYESAMQEYRNKKSKKNEDAKIQKKEGKSIDYAQSLQDLTSSDYKTREKAVNDFTNDSAPKESRAVKPLILILLNRQGEPEYIRDRAAIALGELEDKAAIPALCDALLNDPDNQVRWQAANALQKVYDPSSFDALIKALSDDYDLVRSQAVFILSVSRDKRIIQPFIDFLEREGESEYPRRWAAQGLSYVDLDRAAAKKLIKFVTNKKEVKVVRRAIVVALGNAKCIEAIDVLNDAVVNDEDFLVRLFAAEALGNIGDKKALPALEKVKNDTTSNMVGYSTPKGSAQPVEWKMTSIGQVAREALNKIIGAPEETKEKKSQGGVQVNFIPLAVLAGFSMGDWVALLTSAATIGFLTYYFFKSVKKYSAKTIFRQIAFGLMLSLSLSSAVIVSGCKMGEESQEMSDKEKIEAIWGHIRRLTSPDGNSFTWDSDYKAIVNYGRIAIGPLVENLFDENANTDTRKWCAALLGEVGTYDEVFDILLSVIIDKENNFEWWHVWEAKNGILNLVQNQPFEDTYYYLNNGNKRARIELIQACARPFRERRFNDAFYEIATSPSEDSDVQATALYALATVNDLRLLPLIKKMFINSATTKIKDLVLLLGRKGSENDAAILEHMLQSDNDVNLRIEVLRALNILQGVESYATLLDVVNNTDESIEVRQEAIDLLKRAGSKADLPFLVNVLRNDPNENIRCKAADVLGYLGDRSIYEDLLYAHNNDSSTYVRYAAEDAIQELIKSIQAEQLINTIDITTSSKELNNIIEKLEDMERTTLAVNTLINLLNTTDSEDIQYEIMKIFMLKLNLSFGHLYNDYKYPFTGGTKEERDCVVQSLEKRRFSEKVREMAVWALEYCENQDVVDAMINSFNYDPSSQVRKKALEGLQNFTGEDVVTAFLYGLKNDPDPNVRYWTMCALDGYSSFAVLPDVISALEKDTDEGVRRAAVHYLGDFGDATALPALQEARKHDPDKYVRDFAEEAIAQIKERMKYAALERDVKIVSQNMLAVSIFPLAVLAGLSMGDWIALLTSAVTAGALFFWLMAKVRAQQKAVTPVKVAERRSVVKMLFLFPLMVSLQSLLSACGGGGGGESSEEPTEEVLPAKPVVPVTGAQYFESKANKNTGFVQAYIGDTALTDFSHSYTNALLAIESARFGDTIIKTYAKNNTTADGADKPATYNRTYYPSNGVYNIIKIDNFTSQWWNSWDWSVFAGENAWLGIAALQRYMETGEETALTFAKERAAFLEKLWDIKNGGFRMGPQDQWHVTNDLSFYWNLKSTENNMSALAFFDMLAAATKLASYKTRADETYEYLKGLYDEETGVFYRGEVYANGVWDKNDIELFATDLTTWAPFERMRNDTTFGASVVERLSTLDRMIDETEKRTGVYKNENLVGVSISQSSAKNDVVWIEASAQHAERLLFMARAYTSINALKSDEYSSRFMKLMAALSQYFKTIENGKNVPPYAPYAVYPDGRVAVIQTDFGWYTSSGYAALSNVYYDFALQGFDPLVGQGGEGFMNLGSVYETFESHVYEFSPAAALIMSGALYNQLNDNNILDMLPALTALVKLNASNYNYEKKLQLANHLNQVVDYGYSWDEINTMMRSGQLSAVVGTQETVVSAMNIYEEIAEELPVPEGKRTASAHSSWGMGHIAEDAGQESHSIEEATGAYTPKLYSAILPPVFIVFGFVTLFATNLFAAGFGEFSYHTGVGIGLGIFGIVTFFLGYRTGRKTAPPYPFDYHRDMPAILSDVPTDDLSYDRWAHAVSSGAEQKEIHGFMLRQDVHWTEKMPGMMHILGAFLYRANIPIMIILTSFYFVVGLLNGIEFLLPLLALTGLPYGNGVGTFVRKMNAMRLKNSTSQPLLRENKQIISSVVYKRSLYTAITLLILGVLDALYVGLPYGHAVGIALFAGGGFVIGYAITVCINFVLSKGLHKQIQVHPIIIPGLIVIGLSPFDPIVGAVVFASWIAGYSKNLKKMYPSFVYVLTPFFKRHKVLGALYYAFASFLFFQHAVYYDGYVMSCVALWLINIGMSHALFNKRFATDVYSETRQFVAHNDMKNREAMEIASLFQSYHVMNGEVICVPRPGADMFPSDAWMMPFETAHFSTDTSLGMMIKDSYVLIRKSALGGINGFSVRSFKELARAIQKNGYTVKRERERGGFFTHVTPFVIFNALGAGLSVLLFATSSHAADHTPYAGAFFFAFFIASFVLTAVIVSAYYILRYVHRRSERKEEDENTSRDRRTFFLALPFLLTSAFGLPRTLFGADMRSFSDQELINMLDLPDTEENWETLRDAAQELYRRSIENPSNTVAAQGVTIARNTLIWPRIRSTVFTYVTPSTVMNSSEYKKIRELGEIAQVPLMEQLQNPKAQTDSRKWCTSLLNYVGVFDEIIDLQLKVIAKDGYAWYHSAEASRTFSALFARQTTTKLENIALRFYSDYARSYAIQELGGRKATEAIDTLSQILRDHANAVSIRKTAATALGTINSFAALPHLKFAREYDPDETVRSAAQAALEKIYKATPLENLSLSTSTTLNKCEGEWDAVAWAEEYEIQEATDSGFSQNTRTFFSDDNSFETEDKAEGTYYYRARAVAEGIPSQWSETQSFEVSFTPDTIPPIMGSAANEYILRCNEVPGATRYEFYITGYNSEYQKEKWTFFVKDPEYIFTEGVDFFGSHDSYSWRARAWIGDIPSGWKYGQSFKVTMIPSNVRLVEQKFTTQIQLEWDPVPGATAYIVNESKGTQSSSDTQTFTVSGLTYTTTKKTGKYYYSVRAVIGNVISLASSVCDIQVVESPKNFRSTQGPGKGDFTIIWDTDPVYTKYELEEKEVIRYKDKNKEPFMFDTTHPLHKSFDSYGYDDQPTGTYTYRIRGFVGNVASDWSDPVTIEIENYESDWYDRRTYYDDDSEEKDYACFVDTARGFYNTQKTWAMPLAVSGVVGIFLSALKWLSDRRVKVAVEEKGQKKPFWLFSLITVTIPQIIRSLFMSSFGDFGDEANIPKKDEETSDVDILPVSEDSVKKTLPQEHDVNANTHDPFLILESEQGMEFITEYLMFGDGDNKNEIRAMLEYLKNAPQSIPEILENLPTRFPIVWKLKDAYKRYIRSTSWEDAVQMTMNGDHPLIEKRYAVLGEHIVGETFLDIGCGGNLLGARVLRKHPTVKTVLGVDIEDQRSIPLSKTATPFELMTDPLHIPVENGFADTALLSFVLHHVEQNQHAFLQEVKRVIRPGGRLLVFEDTFSKNLPITKVEGESSKRAKELETLFQNLPTDTERLSGLYFFDWYFHQFIQELRRPVVPGNYEIMETWVQTFEAEGFKVIKQIDLGFSKLGSVFPARRGLFVLERRADEGAGMQDKKSHVESPTKSKKSVLVTSEMYTALRESIARVGKHIKNMGDTYDIFFDTLSTVKTIAAYSDNTVFVAPSIADNPLALDAALVHEKVYGSIDQSAAMQELAADLITMRYVKTISDVRDQEQGKAPHTTFGELESFLRSKEKEGVASVAQFLRLVAAFRTVSAGTLTQQIETLIPLVEMKRAVKIQESAEVIADIVRHIERDFFTFEEGYVEKKNREAQKKWAETIIEESMQSLVNTHSEPRAVLIHNPAGITAEYVAPLVHDKNRYLFVLNEKNMLSQIVIENGRIVPDSGLHVGDLNGAVKSIAAIKHTSDIRIISAEREALVAVDFKDALLFSTSVARDHQGDFPFELLLLPFVFTLDKEALVENMHERVNNLFMKQGKIWELDDRQIGLLADDFADAFNKLKASIASAIENVIRMRQIEIAA